MSVDLSSLDSAPRLLLEASLKPIQGDRFQPTGFPDLGAAAYQAPGGSERLLIESAQSMANRLEAVCWDEAHDDLIDTLSGLPYIRVDLGEAGVTASILEFHRLNSPYIIDAMAADAGTFKDTLEQKLGLKARKSKEERALAKQARKAKAPVQDASGASAEDSETQSEEIPGVVNYRKLAEVVFHFDPNALVHGVFLEKIAGRLRIPRLLSAFIEGFDVHRVDSGGVKFDRVDPAGDTSSGRGNVPYHRTEYVAADIKAFFNLDLAQLRGYGLGLEAERLIIALSLWKVQKLLETGMRLRTACDLDLKTPLQAERPKGFVIPTPASLASTLPSLIKTCRDKGLFADPPVTRLSYTVARRA